MNGLMLPIGFILIGASLMLALLGLGVAVIMPGTDRWSRRFFTVYFSILALYVSFSLAEEISYMRPEMRAAQNIILYLNTLLPAALLLMMTVYLLHCCGENRYCSPLFRIEAVLGGIFFIMLNIAPFSTWFYYVSAKNQFCRGPLYLLMLAFLDLMMVTNLVGVIRLRSRLSKRYYLAFLVGMLPMAIAMFIHFFVPVFELLAIGTVTCALSMFALILSDQIEQDLRQQREIANQRAGIMVLQMRPHFIYNTMMSIYYLCKQNPDLAQQITLDFTTYLRKNFTAIASEEPIPFSAELEHTRAYLSVEQAQFADSLFVDYDTPHIDFRIPPLTLQPIVENAVKHGMDQDSEPLHILIRTRRTDSGSEIVVEDTGPGYEPDDNGDPGIALKNIQQRLEMMCYGSLTIKSGEGGGTVVTVTIPFSSGCS